MKYCFVAIFFLKILSIDAQVIDSTIHKKRNNTLTFSVGGEGFYFGTIVAFEKSLVNYKWFHGGLGIGAGYTIGLPYNRACLPTYLILKWVKHAIF